MNPFAEKIAQRSTAWSRVILRTFTGAGEYVWDHWRELQNVAAVIGTVLFTIANGSTHNFYTFFGVWAAHPAP
jgi:hypothetical protein